MGNAHTTHNSINDAGNPYIPQKFRIMGITKETHDVKTFRMDCRMSLMPGQFVEVAVLGSGECPISVCSSSDSYIDLCIRDVGNVTKAIHSKKKGNHLWLRGPYGKGYPMQDMYCKDVLLIGGGTGVAPLRGAMEYIEKNRSLFRDVKLFFGFRMPHDILFRKDMMRWDRKFDLNVSVDRQEKGWKGEVGFVSAMIDRANIKKDSAAIICGPPVMIKSIMQSLAAKGIAEDNVYISFERLMSCGIGKCGHCELGGKYVCRHGPVFRYDQAKTMMD